MCRDQLKFYLLAKPWTRTWTVKVIEKVNLSNALKVVRFGGKYWRPQGDSNPCCRRERAVS